jgi:hypothetical protein
MLDRGMQRRCAQADQAIERPVHLEDQEDRTCRA